jgi:ribosomal protein S13
MDVIVDNVSLELKMRLEELLAEHVQVIRSSIQDCYSVSMNPPLTDKLIRTRFGVKPCDTSLQDN